MPGTPRLDLGEGFVRQHELIEELRNDMRSSYQALQEDRSSQYLRRCVVRAVFSFIEALIECVKWELRSSVRLDEFKGTLTDKDKETLGSLHVVGQRSDKFLSLDQNIKRTFRLAVKIWGLREFRLNTAGEDFQDFLRAKSARNQLTHPKTIYDIEVTDYDMSYHTVAAKWVDHEVLRLMRSRIDVLSDELSEEAKALLIEVLS